MKNWAIGVLAVLGCGGVEPSGPVPRGGMPSDFASGRLGPPDFQPGTASQPSPPLPNVGSGAGPRAAAWGVTAPARTALSNERLQHEIEELRADNIKLRERLYALERVVAAKGH